MRAAALTAVVTLLLLICAHSGQVSAQALSATHGKTESVALIVGNSAYMHVKALRNPSNDARAVDTALRELGFETILVVDGTRPAIAEAVARFTARLATADVILFYFAGHGVKVNGENFLAPVDIRPRPPFTEQLQSVNAIIEEIEHRAKPEAAKIVILDACRDNPFANVPERPGERLGRGLAPMDLPTLAGGDQRSPTGYFRVIAFATQPGDVAADGEGDHSPYTSSLIKHIRQPGIEAADMFRRVAADVLAATGGRQKPSLLLDTSRTLYFSIPNVTECDRLAIEDQNFLGIRGVPFDDVDPAKAIPACEAATKAQPESARLHNNLARAYEKAERLEEALRHYRRSAEAGYPPAINALGVMYLAGCGMAQPDVAKGVKTISRARDLGSLAARATLTSHDLLAHVDDTGLRFLRIRLAEAGSYRGPKDGAADESLRQALRAYQKREGLADNGLTLETIHALNLYAIVPEGFRCH